MDADSMEYGFKSGQVSTLTISIAGNRIDTVDTDAFLAFSFGDEKYLTFATDLDGYFDVNWQKIATARVGIFIYPGSQLANGDPSTLYDGVVYSEGYSGGALRDAIAGGDYTQWAEFSSSSNGADNFPLEFTIVNDDILGELSLTFNGVTRTYDKPAPILKNFKLYISADVNEDTDGETFQISSITITGYVLYINLFIYFL